jgi:hypothetical protein
MEIKITLSDYQVKSLSYEMANIEEYLQNWINLRADNAAQKLIEAETNRLLNDPNVSTMPATKEELVMSSPLESAWLTYEEDCDTCGITETEENTVEQTE